MTATTRRTLVLGTSLLVPLATFGGRGARAASDAAEIDRDATRAFQQLLREDRRAAALAPKAAGTLTFPRVVKAGFIFGGQGGRAHSASADGHEATIRSPPPHLALRPACSISA